MMEYAALVAKAESDLARLEIKQTESLAHLEARMQAEKNEILAMVETERKDIEATLRYLKKQTRAEPKRHSYQKADGKSVIDLKQVPGRTLIEIVMRVLQSDPSRAFSTPDIIRATGIDNPKYVRSTLATLYRTGKIDKHSRGFYQLLESNDRRDVA
jgi:hypothetical protein